ncbi:asparagine synthase (glutamine-hydrolyzing) [uncultured Thiodictyon sp.]|uniref:asparagine synthase (glutamine-hydrolyzing) n=1 Tax=uncultured Thiodictyon sp. TaxID=1846217 RepID=UPI0025E8C65A|nr:asparagine synthase (glutamine-hydrolyzing) [uncultured Thiodictyon sp.]
MCGFAALVYGAHVTGDEARDAVRRMCERMAVRGPDAEGFWFDQGVALGHRRLAIVDLDPRAGQPMRSACGRYMIVFNGEIYNFLTLRGNLEARGAVFRTTSDTEVLLVLFAMEGEAMLPKLQGMFAFVIWDRLARRAFAARDPYGIKPLYVANVPDGVLLASQVKALLATGLVSREPNWRGRAGFWMLGSVPEPNTWFRDIRVLPAGHCLWIQGCKVVASRCWQDIGEAWRQVGQATVVGVSEVRERVRTALRESVTRHLVADVPVGVFLSGGIDSGTLAGLMVEVGARELQGITIAYDEFKGRHEDEAPVAARIAAHYGIRHYIRRVTRDEFFQDLPLILDAMDQPTVDGVNAWYASKAVAELGLKVVVSGVGGDELFLGYSIFRKLPRLVSVWRALSRAPAAMFLARRLAETQARRTGNGRWSHAADWLRSISGAWWLSRGLYSPQDLPELMGVDGSVEALRDFDVNDWVRSMVGIIPQDRFLALGQIESMTYLRNQLLRDSDWASMAHSVELRTPLVDATLLGTLAPVLAQFPAFRNKSLLSGALIKPLPRRLLERQKTGFGVPVQQWLQAAGRAGGDDGMSRSWARELSTQIYEQI